MRHILLGLLITVVAVASFYGLFRFAKWRGMWSDGQPETPVRGAGPGGGTPPAPK